MVYDAFSVADRLSRVGSVLIGLIILASCVACQQGVSAKALNSATECNGTSPTDEFLSTDWARLQAEVAHISDPAEIYGTDSERLIIPDETRLRYSPEELACWERSRDPLASYIVFLNKIGTSRPFELPRTEFVRRTPRALESLKLAVAPDRCGPLEEAKDKLFDCENGLPEARALYLICANDDPEGCPLSETERVRMCASQSQPTSIYLSGACS